MRDAFERLTRKLRDGMYMRLVALAAFRTELAVKWSLAVCARLTGWNDDFPRHARSGHVKTGDGGGRLRSRLCLHAELVRREIVDVDDVHDLAIVVAQHRSFRF